MQKPLCGGWLGVDGKRPEPDLRLTIHIHQQAKGSARRTLLFIRLGAIVHLHRIVVMGQQRQEQQEQQQQEQQQQQCGRRRRQQAPGAKGMVLLAAVVVVAGLLVQGAGAFLIVGGAAGAVGAGRRIAAGRNGMGDGVCCRVDWCRCRRVDRTLSGTIGRSIESLACIH